MNKTNAIISINGTIEEITETLDILGKLKSAVENGDVGEIAAQRENLSEYISTAHGEHLRFDVPQLGGQGI